MDDRLNVALVGLGDIGERAHLPALLREPRVRVAALVDLDEKLVALAAARAPSAKTTTAIEEVLVDPTIHAVVLATPSWVTSRLAASALEAGKYVLAEKPLASTLAEAEQIAAMPQARARLQIGLTYRHHPSVERLKDLLRDDVLGRPLLVQASVCDERSDPEGDPEGFGRRLRSLERNPPVVTDGVHACDRLNYLLEASPTRVRGWALKSDPGYATANANGAVLEYEDGTVVRLEVIWLFPVLPPSQFVITGPLGRALLDPPTFALRVELAGGDVEELAAPGDKTEVCFTRQLGRFVDACLAGTPPVPGIDAALASLALALRIAGAAGLTAEGAR
ncbi:MAG TPA: Gfo/Idh/MocA family oxidoreductase [Gaiellaceae bacterium]